MKSNGQASSAKERGRSVPSQLIRVPPGAWQAVERAARAWAADHGYKVDSESGALLLKRGGILSSARRIRLRRAMERGQFGIEVLAYLSNPLTEDIKVSADDTYGLNMPARAMRKDRDSLLDAIRRSVPSASTTQTTSPLKGGWSKRQNIAATVIAFILLLILAFIMAVRRFSQ